MDASVGSETRSLNRSAGLLVAVVASMYLMACASRQAGPTGRWKLEGTHAGHQVTKVIELKDDHTLVQHFTIAGPSGDHTMTSEGSWSSEGDSLTITLVLPDGDQAVTSSTFAVTDDTLQQTISFDGKEGRLL